MDGDLCFGGCDRILEWKEMTTAEKNVAPCYLSYHVNEAACKVDEVETPASTKDARFCTECARNLSQESPTSIAMTRRGTRGRGGRRQHGGFGNMYGGANGDEEEEDYDSTWVDMEQKTAEQRKKEVEDAWVRRNVEERYHKYRHILNPGVDVDTLDQPFAITFAQWLRSGSESILNVLPFASLVVSTLLCIYFYSRSRDPEFVYIGKQ